MITHKSKTKVVIPEGWKQTPWGFEDATGRYQVIEARGKYRLSFDCDTLDMAVGGAQWHAAAIRTGRGNSDRQCFN
jgi:hypothetical protein